MSERRRHLDDTGSCDWCRCGDTDEVACGTKEHQNYAETGQNDSSRGCELNIGLNSPYDAQPDGQCSNYESTGQNTSFL